VVFDRSQFEAVLQVGGDSGARELVRRHPDTAWIDVDDPAVRDDIDTVDDVR
jgi:CTP:molybdopterin cytidylyltransferase MocA